MCPRTRTPGRDRERGAGSLRLNHPTSARFTMSASQRQTFIAGVPGRRTLKHLSPAAPWISNPLLDLAIENHRRLRRCSLQGIIHRDIKAEPYSHAHCLFLSMVNRNSTQPCASTPNLRQDTIEPNLRHRGLSEPFTLAPEQFDSVPISRT